MALSRFVIAGAINTGFTYVLYLLFLHFMSYVIAYSITYIVGLGVGYMLNVYWVFKGRPTVKSAAMYPFTYMLNYIFGLLLLRMLVESAGVSREMAPLLVVIATVPLMYLATKFVFRVVGK